MVYPANTDQTVTETLLSEYVLHEEALEQTKESATWCNHSLRTPSSTRFNLFKQSEVVPAELSLTRPGLNQDQTFVWLFKLEGWDLQKLFVWNHLSLYFFLFSPVAVFCFFVF